MIDPVLEAVEKIEDLRREHDGRHDWPELERIGALLTVAQDAEQNLEPRSPAGAKAKLREAARFAAEYPSLAIAMLELGLSIGRTGPQPRHVQRLRKCIAFAVAIPDGDYYGMPHVVPRLEALLRWLLKPGITPPPTVRRLRASKVPSRRAGASATPSGPNASATAWHPWLSIVPATAPPADHETDEQKAAR